MIVHFIDDKLIETKQKRDNNVVKYFLLEHFFQDEYEYVLYPTPEIEEVQCKIIQYVMKIQLRILLQKRFHPIVCLLRRE